MTYGSSQSRCESNVHTARKPRCSACLASSITRAAGGVACSTTPKSTVDPPLLVQQVGQPAPDEPAVAGPPPERAAGQDDRPAGEDRVHRAIDLETLPGRVVHVHVLGGEPEVRLPGRVVYDYVGVGAGRDDALAGVHAEQPGRRGRARLHPASERQLAVDNALVDEVHPVLDGTDAV